MNLSRLLALAVLTASALIAPALHADADAAQAEVDLYVANFENVCRSSVERHYTVGDQLAEEDAPLVHALANGFCGCVADKVKGLPHDAVLKMSRDRSMPDGLETELALCSAAHAQPRVGAICAMYARHAGIRAERYAARCACVQRESDAMAIDRLQPILDAGSTGFDASFDNCPAMRAP